MTRLGQIAVATVFVLAVAGQAVLAIAGVESGAVESDLATSRGSLGWADIFDTDGVEQLSAFLDDRLLYRDNASRLTSELDRVLLRDETRKESRDSVIRGLDGWLFQRDSFTVFCELTSGEAARIVEETDRTLAQVQRAGTQVLFTVAPDKRTISPERLDLGPDLQCEEPGRSAFRDELTRHSGDWFVDLWTSLEAQRDAGNPDLYRQRDTHWTGYGAVTLVSELAGRVRSSVEIEIVDDGTELLSGDLTRVLGTLSSDVVPQFHIENDATVTSVTQLVPERAGFVRRVVSTSPNPMVDGRTVVVLDSFGETALESFEQVFSDVTYVVWRAYELDEAQAAVASADVLIFESAERETPRNLDERLAMLVGGHGE